MTRLLPEADTWARVEGEEDEWIGREVCRYPRVEEAFGVEERCVGAPEVCSAVHDEDGVNDSGCA